jgi:fluoroquinolone transport system permease protein
LLAISLIISILLVIFVWRGPVNWFYLLSGTLLNGWLMTMLGFSLAARYHSINDFFMPALLYLAPSQLPVLDYFGIWQSWLLYLIPTQGAMLLIAGGFGPLAGWQVSYSFAVLIASCLLSTWYAVYIFNRFIVRKRGEGM